MDSIKIYSIDLKESSDDLIIFININNVFNLKTHHTKKNLEDNLSKFFSQVHTPNIYVLSQYQGVIKDIRLQCGEFYTDVKFIKANLKILMNR